MEGYIPPKLDPNCQCICHKQPGIMHVVACCREQQMTPTPHLHALAMRTKAAEMSSNRRGLGPDPQEHPFDRGYVRALKDVHTAILALPLEADHAALLAEAVKLPEIAALIEAAKKTHIYLGDAALGSLTRALQPFLALETP